MTKQPESQTTPQEAIKVLRDSLSEIMDYRGGADNALEDRYVLNRMGQALSATEQVDDGMVLPELPEHLVINTMNYHRRLKVWHVSIDNIVNRDVSYAGGQTPRSAILAAIAKIGEGK